MAHLKCLSETLDFAVPEVENRKLTARQFTPLQYYFVVCVESQLVKVHVRTFMHLLGAWYYHGPPCWPITSLLYINTNHLACFFYLNMVYQLHKILVQYSHTYVQTIPYHNIPCLYITIPENPYFSAKCASWLLNYMEFWDSSGYLVRLLQCKEPPCMVQLYCAYHLYTLACNFETTVYF